MRPRLLELQQFLSFEDASVDFAALTGLVLLSGEHRGSDVGADSNGAGKSALIDGLTWALYGKVARPKHRAEDVVRRHAGEGTRVRLVFSDALGREVEVRRHRKHPRFKDALHLVIDGTDARGSSAAETQKRIDAVVGMGHDTFVGSVLYTQHPMRGRFAELSDPEKKELLDAILGVEVLARARDLGKDELRAATAAMAEFERRTRSLDEQIGWLERQRDDQRERAETWEAGRDRRREALVLRVAAAQRELDALGPESLAAGLEVSGATRVRLEAEQALASAEAEARDADRALEERILFTRTAQARATALLQELRQEAARFDSLGDACPICTQAIAPPVRAAHAAHLAARMAAPARALLEARADLRAAEDERRTLQTAAAAARSALTHGLAKARLAEDASRAEAGRLESAARERTAARKHLADLATELAALDAEENAFEALLLRTEGELCEKAADRTELMGELAVAKTHTERLAFWDRGFGPRGLRSHLLDAVLPLLNARAAHYAGLLTGGALEVGFSTVVEKDDGLEDRFTIHVRGPSGVDSYALLSGGERQRCNLIVNLALQDLVASRATRPLPIAIYDEAFEGLDRTGVEAAMRVLAEAARDKDLVLVVTHQDALRDQFTHELRVVCDRGRSFVEHVS